MKTEKVKGDLDKIFNTWIAADWKDTEQLLEGINNLLSKHKLELILGERSDDNTWVRLSKIKKVGKDNAK